MLHCRTATTAVPYITFRQIRASYNLEFTVLHNSFKVKQIQTASEFVQISSSTYVIFDYVVEARPHQENSL